MPRFSIIIPLYNKEKYIQHTLKSVLNQTFQDFEIIIVNDGSTDQSVALVNEINDVRIQLIHQENQGVSVARNIGIENAHANYICFLDADDFWYPHFLQTFNDLIEKYSDYEVFSAAFEVETKWKTFASLYSIDASKTDLVVNFFDASKKECVIWTSCAVFKKSVFEHVGNFDTTIKIAQDTDLWIRIGMHYPIVFTWNILAIYKHDAESLSKKTDDLTHRLNFKKFEEAEKSNQKLKAYLDLNRYFAALHSKLNGNYQNYKLLVQQIQLRNLPLRKRVLLKTPAFILQNLAKLQQLLVKWGISKSILK
ncbi:glycosyltransferase family 2 protein [Paenimyroides aestuarii]|uniref:Glycosyltransferase family 2 protein n=1 Tax=Paenimyroides aestuarii TaxID=2968490 RepID=A0ABY5NQX8_9FLAO|nr:glycosyltransferase family A protein [Paenimyroides aestuarii]UUV20945.1 glycosyltransferase family 2 protein [Paenimyroides aestuarii]